MTQIDRRAMLAIGAGATALLSSKDVRGDERRPSASPPHGAGIDARAFGAIGDGVTDDTNALQHALDAAFSGPAPGMLILPPGVYRISRTLRVDRRHGHDGDMVHRGGIIAQGARLQSAISDGSPVVSIVSHATVRFFVIDGLEIAGNGKEGAGLDLRCDERGAYFYNFCLRDLVVQGCGGDGCRMVGNIFEGQLFNCYFRDNLGNGARFSHGPQNTVLSAVHVFGSVFGGNHKNGVVLTDGAADVSFHGCYFLLNDEFGLSADHGCTLLSHCGFENNHRSASSFQTGDAGIRLMVFGTLVGCTAYSIQHQRHLIRAFITNELVLIGCTGSGGGEAKGAGLGNFQGRPEGRISLIGCRGGIERHPGAELATIGMAEVGGGPGAFANGRDLARLGDYFLWVDRTGQLRIKRGPPAFDGDGKPVGS